MAVGDLSILNINTQQVQAASYYLLWSIVAVILGVLLLWLLWFIYNELRYKKYAIIREIVGNQEVLSITKVREEKIQNVEMYYYKDLKLYSKRFAPTQLSVFKKKGLFGEKALIGFEAVKYGDKIVPTMLTDNYKIEPIDYDAWNYLVQRLRLNQQKYEKNQAILKVLPFIGLMFVVMAFILGSILWGQHVEKVATMILDKSSQWATDILQKSGGIQVLK